MVSLQTLHDLCLLFIFFIIPWILITFVRKESKLQQKKKEIEIELLQAQIDAIKKGKST